MLLPEQIYGAAQVRQMEAAAIAAGTAGYTLMQRAGAAAFGALRQRWPLARSVVVVAGPGNNGGDGLVLARLARQAGLSVVVLLVAESGALHAEAKQAHDELLAAGQTTQPFDAEVLSRADVVVDALLGIGVRAPLREEWRQVIAAINASQRAVFALDIPSGLDPDQGRALPAVRAMATISFLGLKQGFSWARDRSMPATSCSMDCASKARPWVRRRCCASRMKTSHACCRSGRGRVSSRSSGAC